MSSMICLLGKTPASVSTSALRMTMNSMAASGSVRCGLVVRLAPGVLSLPVLLADETLVEIGQAVHLADLDLLAWRHRNLARPCQGFGKVLDLDDPEPGDQFLCLGEGTVDD